MKRNKCIRVYSKFNKYVVYCLLLLFILTTFVACGSNNSIVTPLNNNDLNETNNPNNNPNNNPDSTDLNTLEPEAIKDNDDLITLRIKEIYDDSFSATDPFPSPIKYNVYGTLDDKYCVGDYIDVTFQDRKELEEDKVELTAVSISESDYKLDPDSDLKPVIYLYPQTKTDVSVKLDYSGLLTKTYPTYNNGWNITAYPDGSLEDNNNGKYPYLFWEGINHVDYDLSQGFCVAGSDTREFLQEKLTIMGLTETETNDFLDFWLHFMQDNPYNLICFQTTDYTDTAKLTISPKPDSMLRIYMTFKPLKNPITIPEQRLSTFQRTGFTVVEWGGSIVQ